MSPPDLSEGPGHRVLADLIAEAGVDTVFSMLGASNVPWIGDGVQRGLFRLVKTRHEAATVTGAAAFSRLRGGLGIGSVSQGAGFTNAVHALTALAGNHQPVLLLVGSVPASVVDQRRLAQTAGAEFHEVTDPADLAAVFWDAAGRTGRDGIPQVVAVNPAVLDGRVPGLDPRRGASRLPEPLVAEPRVVADVVDRLEHARRPLLLAGQGAILAEARAEIERLADMTGARLATTLVAHRFFEGHPADLGICGGWAIPAAHQALRETDLVIGFGSSFSAHTYGDHQFRAGVVAIQVDVAPADTLQGVALVRGDAAAVAAQLCAEWRRRANPDRPRASPAGATRVRTVAAARGEESLVPPAGEGLDVFDALRVIDRALPQNRVIVTDSGRHLPAVAAVVRADDARSFIVTRGHGSIGLGLGGAIGAAAAASGRPVVLICGDGGFMMACQELDAVRLNGLDLLVVILNDEQYGAEVTHLVERGLPPSVARQDLPDIEHLARAFGGRGHRLGTLGALRDACGWRPGLTLLDVAIDPGSDGMAPFAGQMP